MKKKNLLMTAIAIFGLATITFGQTVPSYVPTNGLVGWWPFNGNANDESGNNNNGSMNGGLFINDRNGSSNSALGLPNLGDNLTVSNVAPLFNNFGLSVSVWLRFPNQYNQSSLAIIKNGIPYSNGFDVAIDQNNQAYGENNYLVLFLVGNGTAVTFISNQSELGQWSNLVSTYDGNSIKIYLNGILKATQPFNLSLNCPNNDLIFGQWDNPTTPSVTNRNIDDIGIWNRALTQQEITDLYAGCQLSINTQPSNQQININNNAQFVVGSSDPSATYLWQTDLGVGYQNLNSVGQYSGATTNTLSVSNVTMSNNNQPFRCIINSGSCSDTSNVAVLTVNNNVGINEFTQNNLFSVYPNPAKSQINVKADVKLLGSIYTIYDNLGKVVLSGKINSDNTVIELGNLSGGIYLFRVGDKMKQTFKVIKE
jgi:hypothetical protein